MQEPHITRLQFSFGQADDHALQKSLKQTPPNTKAGSFVLLLSGAKAGTAPGVPSDWGGPLRYTLLWRLRKQAHQLLRREMLFGSCLFLRVMVPATLTRNSELQLVEDSIP
jgi:hypothetical protein